MPRPSAHRRVKTPTILQMEAIECGAASLAIVLSYHGRHVSLEELRLACGVSRDGSKASNIVRAARSYGLIAKGYKKEPGSLSALPLPLIVFWNFNHFLVVEGFRSGSVYLNDPATGPRTVTAEEFDRSFTGVVMTFEPGPDFVKGGNRPTLIASLAPRLSGSRSALLYIVLVGLALVIPGMVIPTFGRIFVDSFLVGGLRNWIAPLLASMALAAVLRGALTWLQHIYLSRLETKFALATSSRFLWHVLHLPVEFFQQRYSGEIGARVELNDRVAHLLSGQLATALIDMVVIVFYVVLMFRYDPVLSWIGIAAAGVNLTVLQLVSRKRVDINHALLHERGKLMATTMSGLQIIETLKAGGRELDFFARWAGHQARVANAEQRLRLASQLLIVVPPLVGALNTLAILALGGLRIMEGTLSMGQLVAFQTLVVYFLTPVNQLVELSSMLQEARGDLQRLDDVLQYPSAHGTPPSQVKQEAEGKLSGRLELRDVTFGYSKLDPPLIQDFSLSLRPGMRVALVGSSGSGKSTVAKLVAGLYEPWQGEILFDGKPRHEISRHMLADSVALVDQDVFLFEGTVRQNLSLWDTTAQDAVLTRAARDASIHEEISSKPAGYDYHVDESGRNYSGGQRQRMELARALANNPALLILDEATSALDAGTEQLVDDNLRRRGCTCLIIAHRLSTIRDCDEIIVLDQGRVVQRGTHDALVRVPNGAYARLMASETPARPSALDVLNRL